MQKDPPYKKRKFSVVERYAVWQTSGRQCTWCDKPLDFRDATVDHLLPEKLSVRPLEFATARKEFGLGDDFDLNGYVNWAPAHSRCNSEKADWFSPKNQKLGRLLEEAAKNAEKASNRAKKILATNGKVEAITRIALALEKQNLQPDDVIQALVHITVNGDEDVRTLQDELALKLAIDTAKAHSKKLENALLSIPDITDPVRARLLAPSQNRSGIIRLLPRNLYRDCLLIREGASYYSFTRLTHEYGYGSDICLEGQYLKTGFAGLAYGFFVPVGDLPLADLMIESPPPGLTSLDGWKNAKEYVPPQHEKELREEQRKFLHTPSHEAQPHCRAPASRKSSYLLRAIDPDKTDVLVAVRVDEILSDGSIVLDWKMLKEFPRPPVIRTPL